MTLLDKIRWEGLILIMAKEELLAFIGAHSKGSRIEKRKAERNPYKSTIEKLNTLKDSGSPLVVTERGSTGTYVVYLDYVGDLWCKGYIKCLGGQEEAQIPYTIRYSDLVTSDIRIAEVE